jgi:hypothetical protein
MMDHDGLLLLLLDALSWEFPVVLEACEGMLKIGGMIGVPWILHAFGVACS